MEDKTKIVGKVMWEITREDGSKESGETHNLVVTDGENFIADRMATTPAMTQMGYMILGTGGTTPLAAFVWVQTYAGFTGNDNGAALTATYPKLKAGDVNTVQYVCTFGAGVGTNTGIDEIIISNVDAAADGSDPGTGDILSYALLTSVINKGALDSIVFTWELTVSAA